MTHAAARPLGRWVSYSQTEGSESSRVGVEVAWWDGARSTGGKVTGVIPRFVVDVEWAHGDLDDLRVVDSMHDQKHLILAESGAVVALPGGCGTLEELLETVTWKQLGLFSGPIVILN